MFGIRAGRGFTVNEDFMKPTRKVIDAKKVVIDLVGYNIAIYHS